MIGWALVSSPKRRRSACARRGEVLLGEEDDLVVEQGLADGAHGGRFELDVEVEAADHPTNGPESGSMSSLTAVLAVLVVVMTRSSPGGGS